MNEFSSRQHLRHSPRPRRSNCRLAKTRTRPSLTEAKRTTGARSRCADDILYAAQSLRGKRRPRCRAGGGQRAELSVRTDVVCPPCAVNTYGNDSPACHASPCRSAASAKPDTPLLGKRDTAPRLFALPMNAAAENRHSHGETRHFASQWRGADHSPRRAVFGHRGFC